LAIAGDALTVFPVTGAVFQSGWHVFGIFPQFVVPAALNAEIPARPTYTIPFATTGDAVIRAVVAVHSGWHVFVVVDVQFVVLVLNADNWFAQVPMYTIPFATAGAAPQPIAEATAPVQSAVQDFVVVPVQFVVPAASNAYKCLSGDPRYTTPLSTTGVVLLAPAENRALQIGWHVFVGEPVQPVVPFALNPYSTPVLFVANTTLPPKPFATTGDE
jgi:hypothetical protein